MLAQLEDSSHEIDRLSAELKSVQDAMAEERIKLAEKDNELMLMVMRDALERKKQKAKCYWRERCDKLTKHEDELEAKDIEISLLKAKLLAFTSEVDHRASLCGMHTDNQQLGVTHPAPSTPTRETARHGKAPPVEIFAGEGKDMMFKEWLPSFERVADWYGWSENDKLIQLVGHLKGKAQREWSLLSPRAIQSCYSSSTGKTGSL